MPRYQITRLTDVIRFLWDYASLQAQHFNGIQSDLKYVVDESQKRSQGKGCDEDGCETELDNYREGRMVNQSRIDNDTHDLTDCDNQ